ncbi:hypothetical protein [Actinomadura sp. 9N407]|uniref:hypothetical protein n=1 Tax=Actinomadura sp. 9N407 TaxID=3375154 RepID=UPI0037AA5B00
MTSSDLRPTGLPEGANSVTFTIDGRTGWVLATYDRCTEGKTGCSLHHPLLTTTTDAGATWHLPPNLDPTLELTTRPVAAGHGDRALGFS